MAALWQPQASVGNAELIDLRRLPNGALDDLLAEETVEWRERLHWDFRPSADLVQRYANIRALDGFALYAGGDVAGYVYWVTEERKALLGDLYLRRAHRSTASENLLLEAAIARLRSGPHFTSQWVRRVEGQLMQSELRAADATPNGPRPRGFVRHFLLAQSAPVLGLSPRELPAGLALQGFGPRYLDETASLIARAYSGHVDSEINDQYRSVEGSRRFLQNVVQYPGCGSFQPACSYVLLDASGVARAVCIASMVAADVGHIPQICVDSMLQGRGVGHELMRRSMVALSQRGAREVSLTVTGRNTPARTLYDRLGFQPLREFDALIWDGLSD